MPESKLVSFFLIFIVENSFDFPAEASLPSVVNFAIGLFSFSLLPTREMAPLDDDRLCSLLLVRNAMSIFLDLAFNGPIQHIISDCHASTKKTLENLKKCMTLTNRGRHVVEEG